MTSALAGPLERLRIITLRPALFKLLAATMLLNLFPFALPASRVLAQAPLPATPAPGVARVAAVSAGQPRGDITDADELLREVQGTARVVQATLRLMQVTMEQNPTAEEIATLQSQVAAVRQRVARVSAHVKQARAGVLTGPAAAETPAGSSLPDDPQLPVLLSTMQDTIGLLRSVITDRAADPATVSRATEMLSQLEVLFIQMHDLLTSEAVTPVASPVKDNPLWSDNPITRTDPGAVVVALPSASASGDADLLGQLEEATGELLRFVQDLATQPAPVSTAPSSASGSGAATSSDPSAHASHHPSQSASGQGAVAATPDPMAAMMQHMADMMAMMGPMMGGMGGGSAQSGSAGAPGMATGTPVGTAADLSLKREAHTNASMIQVQPLNLGIPGMATLDFYLMFDSHGGDLDLDLPNAARLKGPAGNEITPLRWVGPNGGPHIEGTLSFPLTTPNGAPAIAASGPLTLIIAGPAVSDEQQFTWDLGLLP